MIGYDHYKTTQPDRDFCSAPRACDCPRCRAELDRAEAEAERRELAEREAIEAGRECRS